MRLAPSPPYGCTAVDAKRAVNPRNNKLDSSAASPTFCERLARFRPAQFMSEVFKVHRQCHLMSS
jgi:hypothetical protein